MSTYCFKISAGMESSIDFFTLRFNTSFLTCSKETVKKIVLLNIWRKFLNFSYVDVSTKT